MNKKYIVLIQIDMITPRAAHLFTYQTNLSTDALKAKNKCDNGFDLFAIIDAISINAFKEDRKWKCKSV